MWLWHWHGDTNILTTYLSYNWLVLCFIVIQQCWEHLLWNIFYCHSYKSVVVVLLTSGSVRVLQLSIYLWYLISVNELVASSSYADIIIIFIKFKTEVKTLFEIYCSNDLLSDLLKNVVSNWLITMCPSNICQRLLCDDAISVCLLLLPLLTLNNIVMLQVVLTVKALNILLEILDRS